MRRVKIRPFTFFFLCFVLLTFFVRIFHAHELFFWNIDEDLFGLTAKRILIDHRPVLIGYPIPGGIYLGPLFPYVLAFWYWIARMNPFNLPILAALFGSFTTVLIYAVGRKICASKLIGVLAAFFFAFAFLVNVYSRVLTELTLVPILAVFVYLILYQNISDKKPKHLFLLGVVLLISVQTEGSSFSLLVLTVVSWLIFRFKIPRTTLVRIAVLFGVFHLPLVFFDLRHDFFIVKSLINFFSFRSPAATISVKTIVNTLQMFPATMSRFIVISGSNDISLQILPCADLVVSRTSAISPFLFIISVAILGYFIVRTLLIKRSEVGPKIILIHMVVMLLGIFVYNIFIGGWFYEWLLVIFFPGITYILALVVKDIINLGRAGKFLGLGIMISFLFLNLSTITSASNNYGLLSRSRAVTAALEKIGHKPFFLDSIGSCFSQGYNYLFWYFDNFPVQSYADEQLVPTYYQRSTSQKPVVGVVMINPSKSESQSFLEKKAYYLHKTIMRKQVGEIEVLIVRNE